jgi:hypothetical protein
MPLPEGDRKNLLLYRAMPGLPVHLSCQWRDSRFCIPWKFAQYQFEKKIILPRKKYSWFHISLFICKLRINYSQPLDTGLNKMI